MQKDDLLAEAIGLAKHFNTDKAFAEVRGLTAAREKEMTLPHNDLTITGIVDLVGDDFVLDYKTDKDMDPAHHRFQLWAYAEALNKPRAYLAYLRHGALHVFEKDELAKIKTEAANLLEGISAGKYESKPSATKCGYCVYIAICDAGAVHKKIETEPIL